MDKMEVVIITGLSGAGKTKAADWFEDRGYYCVDNMPPALIKNFVELTEGSRKEINKAAFVVDIRGGDFFDDLSDSIENLKSEESIDLKILFFEASSATLIKRYNETRRNHPLAEGATTSDVIQKEKDMLSEIRKKSDYIVDTTRLKVAEMNIELDKIFVHGQTNSSFIINISSFGYKYGIPTEADLIFDMRFIPNPYYVPSLKKLTGNNKKVYNFVHKEKAAIEFAQNLHHMVTQMIPHYIKEGKYHLNIAFGCTGGQHRSVAMANKMQKVFKEDGYTVNLNHRQLR